MAAVVGAMAQEAIEKHQLAGLDDRERGFNRAVTVSTQQNGYRATLHYEQHVVVGESGETPEAAMSDLVRTLHQRGYRRIRSQVSFRGGEYLGNREPWMEYPDPEATEARLPRFGEMANRIVRLISMRWRG